MAVIVSNGATNLSTAGGFYRAESYNMSLWSTTNIALSTARQINVTFANAGNCKGLILALNSDAPGCSRDVTVELQENTGSWTTRASKTLTASEISRGTSTYVATWVRQFEFATPYAVDTTASKWRFNISWGAGLRNWYLRTSNGTAPFYITWCDNAVSFTNNDCVVAKETITIDQSATFKGVLGTGDATYSVCGVACASATPTVGNEGMFVWQNPASSSYTLTLDGLLMLSAQAGFLVGTEANPIPYSTQAKIQINLATSGSSVWSGISTVGHSSHSNFTGRSSIAMYGETPTVRATTLSAAALSGQKDIVTTDTTGWSVGDRIVVTKAEINGYVSADTTWYTIASIAGKNITLTANINTYKRHAGGAVWTVEGYGVDVNSASYSINPFITSANGMYFEGVSLNNWRTSTQNGTSQWEDSMANIYPKMGFYSCVCTNTGIDNAGMTTGVTVGAEDSYFYLVGFCGTARQGGEYVFRNNIFYNCGGGIGTQRCYNFIIEDNKFYNTRYYALQGGIVGGSIQRNVFYGGNAVFRVDQQLIGVTWKNNKIDAIQYGAIWNFGVVANMTLDQDEYGLDVGTVYSIVQTYKAYAPYHNVFVNKPKIGTVTLPAAEIKGSPDGTTVGFQNYDEVDGSDFFYMTYGSITRTGTSLADTTVRTAGGFAMRFEPTYSPNLMHWEQNIPTGNIQNKTMTVSLWVKLNNSAYWAGTHSMPTLTINYDNGTLATAVAQQNTNWQRLDVVITPITTYGQIEMKVTGATDATGTDRYFYVDDVNVAYPAGVAIDLGNLDLWAEGLPVAPAIATMPSLGGVWDSLQTNHTIAGSFGAIAGEILSNTDATQAKIDQL